MFPYNDWGMSHLSQTVLSPHHHVTLQTHRADTLLPAEGMNTHNDLTSTELFPWCGFCHPRNVSVIFRTCGHC